jgi:hypothetical protein
VRTADDELISAAKAEAERRALRFSGDGGGSVRSELPADETQVIETQVVPQPRPRRVTDTVFDLDAVDDRPHFIPGFGGDDDPDATTVITSGSGDTTIVNPGPDDTVVIGSGTDETQVIPPAEVAETTQVIPTGRRSRRGR